jgi:large subunit ribosomal protein L4
MATVDVLDATGKVVGKQELAPELFEAEVKPALMHQVVVAGMAAARAGTHSTKTRGEVRGGGVKPWRQKGTGRARHGSIRSPQWTGGGVAFGPKPLDHSQRLPKKMRRAALRSALSAQAADGLVVVVDGFSFETPKTKEASAALEAIGASKGRVLLVLPAPDEVVQKAFRNLPAVRITYAGSLSTYEVLAADRIVFTRDAIGLVGAGPRGGEASEVAGAEDDAPSGSPEGSKP